MNCAQFTTHVTELVRREPMDSPVRADCLSHVAECARCGQWLAESEVLQHSLTVFADADARKEAPVLVEQQLLSAFRQRIPVEKRQTSQTPLARRWPAGSLLAVAAILFVVAALTLTIWQRNTKQLETIRHVAANTLATPLPPSESARAGNDAASRQVPAARRGPDADAIAAARSLAARRREAIPASVMPAKMPAETLAEMPAETEEALTDYLLFNSGQRFYPMERGQLIRVSVPRSMLGSFGFTVNPERAMVPVKADLLVGEDGMARAIRFIK